MAQVRDHQWLEPWKLQLQGKSILELGCGSGIDTRYLASLGCNLTSCDLKLPKLTDDNVDYSVTLMAVDHSQPLPFQKNQFDVVIASLSLHYFEWQKTLDIIAEIHRVLAPLGTLICRVNSTQDVNYGATGYPQLASHFFSVNGQAKRFFDRDDLTQLFQDQWQINHLTQLNIDRYEKPKSVWQLHVTKA